MRLVRAAVSLLGCPGRIGDDALCVIEQSPKYCAKRSTKNSTEELECREVANGGA
jgi:hypothetical protein